MLVIGAIAIARLYVGADVGEPCNDFILSCRATRGILTINACVHTGPTPEESYCSYTCDIDGECPEGWSCEPAGAWSNVPGAMEDVQHACRPPHHAADR